MPTLSSRFVPPRQNCCRSIATLFTLIILAGNVQFVSAVPTLTLTEQSSTTLNYSGTEGFGSGSVDIVISKTTGLPVPDQWLGGITGPTLTGDATLNGSWREPGPPYNNVTVAYTTAKGWVVTVTSDAATAAFTPWDNNTPATYSGAPGNFIVIFNDQAAASEVPEGGTTVIMLSLAVGAIALMRRRLAAA